MLTAILFVFGIIASAFILSFLFFQIIIFMFKFLDYLIDGILKKIKIVLKRKDS